MAAPVRTISDGRIEYRLGGKLHREDGPAVIRADGSVEYRLNARLHRETGPAVIKADGEVEYWLRGKRQVSKPPQTQSRPALPPRPEGHTSAIRCPICLEAVRLPARTAGAGVVYCQGCIEEVILATGRDPITRARIHLGNIARLDSS